MQFLVVDIDTELSFLGSAMGPPKPVLEICHYVTSHDWIQSP
jgi:hypothetical protein